MSASTVSPSSSGGIGDSGRHEKPLVVRNVIFADLFPTRGFTHTRPVICWSIRSRFGQLFQQGRGHFTRFHARKHLADGSVRQARSVEVLDQPDPGATAMSG